MKKIFNSYLLLCFTTFICLGQDKTNLKLDNKITDVAFLKWEFEKRFRIANTHNTPDNVAKKDSLYCRYLSAIDKLKKDKITFSRFIDSSLNNNAVLKGKETIPYKYVSMLGPFDKNKHFINRTDFYRIIKYFILEKDEKVLPDNFHDLPFIDKKNYKPMPSTDDYDNRVKQGEYRKQDQ